MKLSRKAAAAVLAAALTLSLCVISALPGGQPRMDAMTYNIDTLPARDLRPVVDGPETEADYTPPAQAIHTAAQEEATAEVSAEAPAPEAPAQEKVESTAPAQPAQPVSSTSVLAVGVTADSVRLRAAANTGSAILAELNRGTAVSVLGRQDGWYKVNYDGKTGYMSADYVTARSSAGDLRCVARVISDGLNLRSGAAASGAVLATVSRGEYVDVSGFENGWFRVQYSGKTGYMSGDHLTLAAARPAAPAPAPTAPTTPAVPASGTGAEIAALARSFVGKAPYVYGGAGPAGFDCSGFTMYIWSVRHPPAPRGHGPDALRHRRGPQPAAARGPDLLPRRLLFLQHRLPLRHLCGQRPVCPRLHLWKRRRPADGAERQSLLLRPLYRRPAHGLKRCILKTVPASAGTVFLGRSGTFRSVRKP